MKMKALQHSQLQCLLRAQLLRLVNVACMMSAGHGTRTDGDLRRRAGSANGAPRHLARHLAQGPPQQYGQPCANAITDQLCRLLSEVAAACHLIVLLIKRVAS